MNAQEILSKVDHALLKQTATWADIKGICEEAVKYHTATVMIPSCFITKIRENYGDKLKIATVVGFPNGNCNTAARLLKRHRLWPMVPKKSIWSSISVC